MSEEHRPKLLSAHGTFVGFDSNGNCLVVCTDHRDARCVRLHVEKGKAAFSVEVDGKMRYVVPSIDGFLLVDDLSTVVQRLDVIGQEGGYVSLGLNGFFFAAHPDGSLDFQPWMQIHEKFWLLHDDSVVTRILSNHWHSESLDRFVHRRDIALRPNFEIGLSDLIVTIDDLVFYAYSESDREIYLIYQKYKVERLILFKPLIYFCAYGDQRSFDLLACSLRSFEKYGRFDGDYAIVTDKSSDYIEKTLSFIDRERITVIMLPVVDVIDMVSARYKITDCAVFQHYQPIIYSDFDIVCNAPIANLCERALTSGKPLLRSEGTIDLVHYGSVLIQGDEHLRRTKDLGFNSGVIAFKNIDAVRASFRMIVACMYSHIRSGLPRYDTTAYDQSAANYVFNKMIDFDIHEMDNYVFPWPPAENEHISGRGLIHFCGGVGAGHKVDRIISYYEYLERQPR
ncbi:hypothetical protein [Methylobacterium oryzihabitans]|uniref:Uncharacterized protein n=1 Tax=Methylobacterium oryzihabitans TaxID=2499852 RepID=A0A3S2V2W1_9HYPH|nr:hypothetical protein [Methylobacterium oryzihabitans]RVU14015.1 hypothetical protein EOE48_25115 [Methylobacterium oryzihabitans]